MSNFMLLCILFCMCLGFVAVLIAVFAVRDELKAIRERISDGHSTT